MSTIEDPSRIRQDLYLEVLQHYARQMRQLDDRDLSGYAATFTEDAVFDHGAGGEPARTRAGILELLEAFHRQLTDDPQQRRHHFSMVDVAPPGDDGALDVTCYALVLLVRPGEAPEIKSSCVVRDVLVREGGQRPDGTAGELRNRSRLVTIDGRVG